MRATFIRKHSEAENIITFWFKPEKPLSYLAGQYIEMTEAIEHPDQRGNKHYFTLSSSPTDAPLISITTKFALDKSSSFKTALRHFKPGKEVSISEPMGDFVLPKDPARPLVFVAGGIGLTPFHSMIKWLIDTHQERQITFLYSVRSERELVFQDLFERYGLKRALIVSQPGGNWSGEVGQLNAQRILDLAKPSDEALIYISGPEPMVEALTKGLEDLGRPKNQLVGDYFPGYTAV